MASIEDAVLESFLERLSDESSITDVVAAELRAAIVGVTKLPTPDEIARIFIDGSGDKLA